jgi:hypothetical protein
MVPKRKRVRVLIIFFVFIVYFLIAARPIPRETILAPGWISSLGADSPVLLGRAVNVPGQLLPFALGNHFGYVDSSGQFSINRSNTSEVFLGERMWTEYSAEPSNIEIKNTSGETILNIDNVEGYPILLDNRVFIFGSEQNSLSEIGTDGNILWTYEYSALLTCIDAAAGLVLTGSIDGIIEILDSSGQRIFYFKPGGSRFEVVYGVALSKNGARLGVICGLDQQRFLLLERLGNSGGEYRIIYHEFLEAGFRREVHISFIDEDRRVIFERAGGIGCYNIRSRRSIFIPLEGEITAIDTSGDNGVLFLITSHAPQFRFSDARKELVGIKFPQDRRRLASLSASTQDSIFLRAPFGSDDVFLGRVGPMLITGGGTTLISFNLEAK